MFHSYGIQTVINTYVKSMTIVGIQNEMLDDTTQYMRLTMNVHMLASVSASVVYQPSCIGMCESSTEAPHAHDSMMATRRVDMRDS